VPLSRCFFFLKSTDLSRFNSRKRRMRPGQDEEKASKSGLPPMLSRNYKKPPYGRLLALKTT